MCVCVCVCVYIYIYIYMILDINFRIWIVCTYVVPVFSFLAFLVTFFSATLSVSEC